MAQQMMQKDGRTGEPASSGSVETCQRCGNTYILLWFEQGDGYRDFGDRHCPFCGLVTDQVTGSVVE